jgi:hypothetical protein
MRMSPRLVARQDHTDRESMLVLTFPCCDDDEEEDPLHDPWGP